MTGPGERDLGADDGPWRLFASLPVPADVRGRLEDALAPVRAATRGHLRWVPSATWHVTLAFLGDVAPARVGDATAATGRAAGHGPVEVSLAKASRFGRGLLFLALDDTAFAGVRDLGEGVRRALDDAGVDHDRKPLHPHVTLARQRDRRGRGVSRGTLDQVEAVLAGVDLGARSWVADEVVLVRSHLGDGPVRHQPVARVPLRP